MAALRVRQTFVSSGEPYTVYIPDDGDTSGLASVISSLSVEYGGIYTPTTTDDGSGATTISPGGSLSTRTTFATSISNGSYRSGASSMGSSMYSAATSRQTTSASTATGTAGAGLTGALSQNACTRPSCSSGLQAAIAIGVLVGVMIIAAVVILNRRNKKAMAANRSAAPIRAQALEDSAAPGSSGGLQGPNPGMSEVNSGAPRI